MKKFQVSLLLCLSFIFACGSDDENSGTDNNTNTQEQNSTDKTDNSSNTKNDNSASEGQSKEFNLESEDCAGYAKAGLDCGILKEFQSKGLCPIFENASKENQDKWLKCIKEASGDCSSAKTCYPNY